MIIYLNIWKITNSPIGKTVRSNWMITDVSQRTKFRRENKNESLKQQYWSVSFMVIYFFLVDEKYFLIIIVI